MQPIMTKRIFQIIIVITFVATIDTNGQSRSDRLMVSGHDLWALSPRSNDFYGLFVKKHLMDNWFDFELQKIDITDYYIGPEAVNYDRVKKDDLLYVFRGFDSLQTNIRGWKFNTGYLLPGQSLLAGEYHIYSKGQIIESMDSTSTEVFDAVDNYRVGLKTKVQGKTVNRPLTDGYRLTRWVEGSYLGGLSVDWVGDLNGDGRPEIIMTQCGHHECFDIVLYSPDKNFNFKEIYRNTICGG
jgi:hypothetical protein